MKPPLEYYDALRVTETGPWGRELDGSFSCEVRVFLRATDSIGLAAQVPGIDCGEDGSFEIARKARLPGAVFLESWKTGSQMGLDQLKAKEIHLVVAAMARAIMQIRSHGVWSGDPRPAWRGRICQDSPGGGAGSAHESHRIRGIPWRHAELERPDDRQGQRNGPRSSARAPAVTSPDGR